jgi:DNA-binding transcriptional ArsR family regulator
MPERRLRISDPRALRALAHPLRLALLDQLMAFGEQTAAQCADAVGSTASNCSYHLRSLARVGLVERAVSSDGRERPWRSVATGLEFGPERATDSPAAAGAAQAVDGLELAREEELTRRALARHAEQPAQWQAAETNNSYGLRLTASELADLVEAIDGLVRPYIGLTRERAPADAEVVYLRLLAFRHPHGE